MANKPTLREQIKAWKETKTFIGENPEFFYFFDWFCQNKALADRARRLMPKVVKFARRKNIDLDNTRVIFKNNCPMEGELYDDFRIIDMKTEDVLWTVCPFSGHRSIYGQAELWGKENNFGGPIKTAKMWIELITSL